jgi:hypothetical protein
MGARPPRRPARGALSSAPAAPRVPEPPAATALRGPRRRWRSQLRTGPRCMYHTVTGKAASSWLEGRAAARAVWGAAAANSGGKGGYIASRPMIWKAEGTEGRQLGKQKQPRHLNAAQCLAKRGRPTAERSRAPCAASYAASCAAVRASRPRSRRARSEKARSPLSSATPTKPASSRGSEKCS